MRFVRQFMTATEIGKIVGKTSVEVGNYLEGWGYRERDYRNRKQPNERAKTENLVDFDYTYNPPHAYWDVEKVVAMFEEDGVLPIFPPPGDLVFEPQLKGPFSLKQISENVYLLVSDNGDVSAKIEGKANAEFLKLLLNTADNSNIIEKYLQPTA